LFLKRLEISGFKSFAERAVLDFSFNNENAKISAIVGPNGSGKSNIVDAIRWVLGEQSYRLLRSKKSEDVIFLGSAKKQKGSAASISMTLDNSKKEIPIEFSEVSIGRKVYRSGETDYFINNAKVRLLDVQELLSKCGFGQTTYTVLGQGMVDQLLFYGPSERRVLFDEAAGVKQYQIKREQSLRKLEATDQNILRTKDVYSEIGPRLKFLKRQLDRASEKKILEEELKDLQLNYYASKIQNPLGLITRRKKEKESQKIEILALQKGLIEEAFDGSYSKEILNLQENLEILEKERDLLKEKCLILAADLRVEENKNQAANSDNLLDEKREKESKLDSVRQSIIENKNLLTRQKKELAEFIKELSAIKTKLLDTQDVLKSSESEESLLKIKGDFQRIEKEHKEVIELLEKDRNVETAKKRLEGLLTSFQNLWEKIKTINRKDGQTEIVQKIETISNQKNELSDKINKTTLDSGILEREIIHLEAQGQNIEKEIAALEERIKNYKSLNPDKEKTILLKTELSTNEEELSKKEKEILEAKEELKGIYQKREKEEETKRESRRKNQTINEEINKRNYEIRDLDIDLARLETRLDDLEEEMEREGLKFDVRDRKVPSDFKADEVEQKIYSLKKKVASIGEVDIDSEEELSELAERHQFLEEQITDLESAKEDLKKVILELDERIKRQFNEAFIKISEEFKTYFKILFEGGNADLTLERIYDEETEKETLGIEITACPPGKKIKNLSALSGGERSLASMALLFAILSVNPSPFVVLDEVDAALDENNTKRFLRILKELSKKTQFIIITHNRDTMQSAESLYGVTMDDSHASRLLSLKLTEAEEIGAKKS